MDLGLAGKVAIITGSSRGLGLASARALVAEGCNVCICGRGEDALSEAAMALAHAAIKTRVNRDFFRNTWELGGKRLGSV